MFNFFVDIMPYENVYEITGKDYNHIKNVLRMKIGEQIIVSFNGKSDLCAISRISDDIVYAEIIEKDFKDSELPLEIYLFQGLPKSDKMELIIQKTVELGISKVVPVEMKRCVVKLDEKKKNSKTARWQAIAESAAKQSKRNVIPTVSNVITYKEFLEFAHELDLLIVPYENEKGMISTKEALGKIKPGMKIGILIGSEGGFEDGEIEAVKKIGADIVSLGKRILRTETAAITTVSMLMLFCEMNFSGE